KQDDWQGPTFLIAETYIFYLPNTPLAARGFVHPATEGHPVIAERSILRFHFLPSFGPVIMEGPKRNGKRWAI
ncbi:hypothetical protein, partial [Sporosarcina sp. NCCP-2716]|uniref:hypothetical protein n=1 Tax=Sporosarcina sp. NCCP-2716 TaxID=2943679 RepID=UPI00203D8B0F